MKMKTETSKANSHWYIYFCWVAIHNFMKLLKKCLYLSFLQH